MESTKLHPMSFLIVGLGALVLMVLVLNRADVGVKAAECKPGNCPDMEAACSAASNATACTAVTPMNYSNGGFGNVTCQFDGMSCTARYGRTQAGGDNPASGCKDGDIKGTLVCVNGEYKCPPAPCDETTCGINGCPANGGGDNGTSGGDEGSGAGGHRPVYLCNYSDPGSCNNSEGNHCSWVGGSCKDSFWATCEPGGSNYGKPICNSK